MGNILNTIGRRIFEFPIKGHPICFLQQEEYCSTGEQIQGAPLLKNQELEYEKLLQNFNENVKAKKKKQKMTIEDHQASVFREVLESFPGWNDMTISILHHLFLIFANPKNSLLSFDDFCAILEYLGDYSNGDVRANKFDQADSDKDGFLQFSEFLPTVYNFNPSKKDGLKGVAKLCKEAADRSSAVSSLTLGEQLEYGLF